MHGATEVSSRDEGGYGGKSQRREWQDGWTDAGGSEPMWRAGPRRRGCLWLGFFPCFKPPATVDVLIAGKKVTCQLAGEEKDGNNDGFHRPPSLFPPPCFLSSALRWCSRSSSSCSVPPETTHSSPQLPAGCGF